MRILLTNTPLRYYHRQAFVFRDWGAYNLALLATLVDGEHEVRTLDNWHFVLRAEGIRDAARAFRPHLVGFNHNVEVDTEEVVAIARVVRDLHPGIVLVAGGQAAAPRAADLLANGFDFVVQGEGEITFPELVRALAANRSDFSGIPGLIYRQDGRAVATAPRPFLPHLDQSPFPLLKHLPRLRSWHFPGAWASVIETSRGCPFACEFCMVTTFWQRSYRKRSNARILAELLKIRDETGAIHLYFIDDSFGLRVDEYTELCQMMVDANLGLKWFSNGIRADVIAKNPELIRLAARAGLFGALVGFESYSDEVLDSVRKETSRALNARASEVLRRNNVISYGVHVFGLPGETSFEPTYRQGARNSDIFSASMLSVIPGTPLYDRCAAESVADRIPTDRRYYPYSVFLKGASRRYRRMTLVYLGYILRYHLSPLTLRKALASRGVLRRMWLLDYLSCVQYVCYLVARKLGLRIV